MFVTTFVKQLAYVLIATCAAFAAHGFLNNLQSAWVIWATFLFLQITSGETPWQRMLWVLVAGLLTMASVFVVGLIHHPHLLSVYGLILVFLGTYWGNKKPNYLYISLVVIFFTLFASNVPVDFVENRDRVTLIGYSALMVACLQILFLPWFYRDERRISALNMIRNMRLFNAEAFACYLDPSYPDNVYLYERRLHVRKNRVLFSLSRLKRLENPENPYSRVRHYEALYQILLDCAQLRRRVTDHTLFLLCKEELATILEAMDRIFIELVVQVKNRHKSIDTERYDKSVKRLESSYQNILSVTAREPQVLLFFIEGLKSFKEEADLC